MELNWDNAKLWQEKVNEKKEIYDEPKWRWDCGCGKKQEGGRKCGYF